MIDHEIFFMVILPSPDSREGGVGRWDAGGGSVMLREKRFSGHSYIAVIDPYQSNSQSNLGLCLALINSTVSSDSANGELPASVAQLDAPSNWRPGGRGFNLRQGRQHSFVEIDHEIFSTVILSLLLIKKGSCQFLAKECAQYW